MESGTEIFWLADAQELDASEVHVRRLNAKEVLVPKNRDEFIFPCADGAVKLEGKDQEVRTSIPTRNHPEQGERHCDNIQGEAVGSDPAEQPLTNEDEVRDGFGRVSWHKISRHHV